jgi:hypothetical protein
VNLGDLGGRCSGVEHLLKVLHPLGIGERPALVVFHDLLGDAFDHLGLLVAAAGGTHIDRHGGQPGLTRRDGAALTGAPNGAVVVAHRRDRHQHPVFLHAGQELGVHGGGVANVVAEICAQTCPILDV